MNFGFIEAGTDGVDSTYDDPKSLEYSQNLEGSSKS